MTREVSTAAGIDMANWKRYPVGGRFCEWRRSKAWRGRPRALSILPRPGYGFEWSVDYGPGWGTLRGVRRSVFSAMREAEMRAMRVKRFGYRPAFQG